MGSQNMRLPRWLSGKESACSAGDTGEVGSIPGSGRIPGGGKWQPTPVFLPEKSYGQRRLAGHSPWGHKDLDMTEPQLLRPLNLQMLKSHI